jgi:hypothetical protein
MAKVTAPGVDRPIKLLLIGDSSTGKTGGLASLAAAGYNVRILDLDNGSEIFWDLFCGPKPFYPTAGAEGLARVDVITCTDSYKSVAGSLIPSASRAWLKAVNLLDNWKDRESNFGPIKTWGPRDVLVIDSLTRLSTAAENFHLSMNNRLGKTRTQNEIRRDIGGAQALIEQMLRMLYDSEVKCNVIVISHITYVTDESAKAQGVDSEVQRDSMPSHGYPSAIGRALSPRIPQYFNSCLQVKVTGEGLGARHRLYTRSQGAVNLKTSAPGATLADYPLLTGLADYFKALRGGWTPDSPDPPPPAAVATLAGPAPQTVIATAPGAPVPLPPRATP